MVGTTVGHVRDLRRLQERSAAFAQFFSPPIREAIAVADPDIVLAPQKTEVCVLFCDLRGFTRQSEQQADDLFGLLQRVSQALGIMTRQILDHGGVVGDFHGDAAMGFWGWPLVDGRRVEHACQAALAIRSAFEAAAQGERNALSGFRVGMGLATGEAVAGKLGTSDQVKVTAFGPVVNLASRLEGLTRAFGVPILVNAPTAQSMTVHGPISWGHLRHVAAPFNPMASLESKTSMNCAPDRLPVGTILLSGCWTTPCTLFGAAIGQRRERTWSNLRAKILSASSIFNGCSGPGTFLRPIGTEFFVSPTSRNLIDRSFGYARRQGFANP